MNKTIRRILFSKSFFFIAAALTILSLNLTPLVAHFRHSPEGRTFAMIHNNAQDFFFYQSLMNQGANGAWLTSDSFTTEKHEPSIVFAYFVWLGKLAKIFHLPYPVIYHLLRIVLGIFFLFSAYYLLYLFKVSLPRLAFLFFVFAAPFMHNIVDWGSVRRVPFMHWWTGIDPVRRVAYLPHHMYGGFFLIVSIILIYKYFNKPNGRKLASLILIALSLAFIHTPSLFILLLILPPTLILNIFLSYINNNCLKFKKLKLKIMKKEYLGLLIYWLVGFFSLLLMVSQTGKGFPWSQYLTWEKRLQFPLLKELPGALGIILPLSLLGAIKAIMSKKFKNILIVCWLFIPFILIPMAPSLNISNIRLIQSVPYLPLSILAVIGLEAIINTSSKLLKKISYRKVKMAIIGFTILIFTIFSFPAISWSVKDQIREYWPIFGNVYFDNRMYRAFDFINRNYPSKATVLSTFYTGNYLPSFTDTISYLGHFGYTYNNEEKQQISRKFFENKMSSQEAKNFLLSNKIDLIFQGPEEKPIYPDYLYPEILKVVYDTEEVTLYTLIQ